MASTHEDGFREIQLSGKQLVFCWHGRLVVIAVGIFLMGVQVGRGVLAQRGLPDAGADDAFAREAEPPPPPASVSQDSHAGYRRREIKLRRTAGVIRAACRAIEESGRRATRPRHPPKARTLPRQPATPRRCGHDSPRGPASRSRSGLCVTAGEADGMVKRLVAKGYPAYVVAPAKGTPAPYRVRVGKFKERREADTVAAKLQKEEQFKPWVVR